MCYSQIYYCVSCRIFLFEFSKNTSVNLFVKTCTYRIYVFIAVLDNSLSLLLTLHTNLMLSKCGRLKILLLTFAIAGLLAASNLSSLRFSKRESSFIPSESL